MRVSAAILACIGVVSASSVAARPHRSLDVTIANLSPDGRLPIRAAFCAPDGSGRHDASPPVRWSKGPASTRSYVLLMTDSDVPADLGLIDRPGTTIAAKAARQRVFHWVLTDIPASTVALAEGADGDTLVAKGKPLGETSVGRRGANVYTTFLRGIPGMAGTYGGYDGPCPPKNDARTHRYVLTIYALDVPSLGLNGAFDGQAVEAAMAGHILTRGSATALYDRKGG